jgi:phosphatidylinositol alpha-1,6-mannosyltransferase
VKSPGKVILIANNFPPIRGGSAVVYDNLAKYSGGRIIVIAPQVNYTDGLPIIGWREHDRMASYRVIRLRQLRTVIKTPSWRGYFGKLLFRASDLAIRLRLIRLLLKLIRTESIDAVCIGELMASGWLISLLRRVSIVRILVYVHGEEITTEDPYDGAHERARRALLGADRIIAVSRFTLDAVRDLLGAEADGKISLVENGVDSSRFCSRGKRPDLVELYQLQDRFVFVSVCRLLEKKGIDHAIRAFAKVVRRHPECRYLVVGTGPYEDQLRDIAATAGVTDSMVFAGDVPDEDLAEHYCLGDVFVMPNRQLPNGDTEGFGLVFLEANSCGIPVIAGRDGGSRDAVQHGTNGLVVDGGSIDEIAAAMLTLRENTALREALRHGGLGTAAAANWRRKAGIFLRLCARAEPTDEYQVE